MRIKLSLLVLAAATQVGATDCGQVLRDPGFDLWCGDDLCAWKIVRGDARRVPTWHEGDSGVELLGDDAAIMQLAPVNHGDGTCIRFDLVANVAETAEARLVVDIYGDGNVELSERIPTSSWKPLSYKLKIKTPYTGIRFELSKRGAGSAVFAQIEAEIDQDCEGLPELDGGLAPLGAGCATGLDCASELCSIVSDPESFLGFSQRCVACDARLGEAACPTGEVCGRGEPGPPALAVPIECVAEAGDELGEQCLDGRECASGFCTAFVCSACTVLPDTGASVGCGAGQSCGPATAIGPWVCNPGSPRPSGEPCATASDCASGVCNGTVRKACGDGRPCASNFTCPVTDGLVPGTCSTYGVQGGSCG